MRRCYWRCGCWLSLLCFKISILMCEHKPHRTCWVRGQLYGVGSLHFYRGWEGRRGSNSGHQVCVQALVPPNCLASPLLGTFNQKRKFCWFVSKNPDAGTGEMPQVVKSTGCWFFQGPRVQFPATTFIYNGIQFPSLACRSTCRALEYRKQIHLNTRNNPNGQRNL